MCPRAPWAGESQGRGGVGAGWVTPPLFGTNSKETKNSKFQSNLSRHEVGILVKVEQAEHILVLKPRNDFYIFSHMGYEPPLYSCQSPISARGWGLAKQEECWKYGVLCY